MNSRTLVSDRLIEGDRSVQVWLYAICKSLNEKAKIWKILIEEFLRTKGHKNKPSAT